MWCYTRLNDYLKMYKYIVCFFLMTYQLKKYFKGHKKKCIKGIRWTFEEEKEEPPNHPTEPTTTTERYVFNVVTSVYIM